MLIREHLSLWFYRCLRYLGFLTHVLQTTPLKGKGQEGQNNFITFPIPSQISKKTVIEIFKWFRKSATTITVSQDIFKLFADPRNVICAPFQ